MRLNVECVLMYGFVGRFVIIIFAKKRGKIAENAQCLVKMIFHIWVWLICFVKGWFYQS